MATEFEALLLQIPGIRRAAGSPAPAAPSAAPHSCDAAGDQPASKRSRKQEAGSSKKEGVPAVRSDPVAAPPVPPVQLPLPLQAPVVVTEVLSCPASCVGQVIGKGGANVKGLQGLTGCAIQVSREGTGDRRDVSVSGVAPAAAVALAMLQQLIEHAQNRGCGARSTESRVELRVPCDASKIGWVVGPGGATVKAVRALSGATLDVLEEVTATGGRKGTVVVTGSAEEVEAAKLALQGLLGARDCAASKAYAQELLAAAQRRAEWDEAEAKRLAPPPAPPPAAGEPAQAQSEAVGWKRLSTTHPDGTQVPFWLHEPSGTYSW